jgi:hypothetical protein
MLGNLTKIIRKSCSPSSDEKDHDEKEEKDEEKSEAIIIVKLKLGKNLP